MFERFTDAAHGVVVGARRQAQALHHPAVGTEHLLLALLDPASGAPSTVLRAAGIDADMVRASLARHVGTPRPPASALTDEDAEALRGIGIDLKAVLARLEQTLGADALSAPAPAPRRALFRARSGDRTIGGGGRIRISPRTKKVLELSLREAIDGRQGRICAEHLLLGLLREGNGMAALILAEHGVDLQALRAATLRALDEAA
jgi:ATP-dependent Clp protease ATP-binding subunit ClpA